MNKFLKALIISLIIFVIHFILFATITFFKHGSFGYYGLLGGVAYAFVFAFWAYYILALFYLYSSKSTATTMMKVIHALIVVTIGYFIARAGDIVDGDFLRKFDLTLLLIFLLSSLLVVLLDRIFRCRKIVN